MLIYCLKKQLYSEGHHLITYHKSAMIDELKKRLNGQEIPR